MRPLVFSFVPRCHAESILTAGFLIVGWAAADGVIHLIDSCLHYRFNLKWLQTPPEVSTNRAG